MPSGQIGLMRLTNKLGILTIGTLVIACSLMPPRRQYIKEVKRQVIPKELLNCQWTLETIDNKKPDCSLTMKFLDKGELTFTIQGRLFEGDYLWYIVKDSIIKFHAIPLDKFAFTEFNCEPKPDTFAQYLLGVNKVLIRDKRMTLLTYGKEELIFKKV
jgi:hypothetical protein